MHLLLFSLAVVQIHISGSQGKPQVAQNEVSGSWSCRDSIPSCSVWGDQCGSTTDARYRDEWCRKTCGTCVPDAIRVANCPSPWFRIADQCFLLVNDKSDRLPWSSARTQCGILAPGADLAQLRDLGVHSDLVQYILDKGPEYWYDTHYWLGGSDLNTEGEWRWINGETIPVGKNNGRWNHLEPNNHKSGEDCLEFYPWYHSHISFNDKRCEKSQAFICERY